MSGMPTTLEGTIEALQRELKDLIPDDPHMTKEDREAAERLLAWLSELHELKTGDAAALENAIDALKRIVDGVEMNPLVTSGDAHYANRINKLIRNLEEVIVLESKRPKL